MTTNQVPDEASLKNRAEDEQRLVSAMIAGDKAAWKEFSERYDRLVMRCITQVTRKFAALLSDEDVYEIRAAFYVSLLVNDRRRLRTFDPSRARLSSWVGLLASNRAYELLRIRRSAPASEDLDSAKMLAVEAPDPFDLTASRERGKLARRAIESLDREDRDFIFAYTMAKMEPAELAARLGISVKTIYTRRFRIESRLVEALKPTG